MWLKHSFRLVLPNLTSMMYERKALIYNLVALFLVIAAIPMDFHPIIGKLAIIIVWVMALMAWMRKSRTESATPHEKTDNNGFCQKHWNS